MQTPGRQTEPQTPMIPFGPRMEGGLNRVLQRAEEGAKNIERPRVMTLGKVISQLNTIGTGMREMRNQIRNDIKVKQQYYKEESKILKKDSENLDNISSKLLRGSLGGLAAGAAVSQFASGNIREGLSSAGLASLLLAPEILNVISGSVVQLLAVKGLIGGNKQGVSGLGQNVRGASKLKNPLLMTAALAASLIIPSLMKGQDSSDKRRRELIGRSIGGGQIINRPDVNRFRGQLARFESILDNMNKQEERRGKKNTLRFEEPEPVDFNKNLPREETKNQALDFLDVFRNKNEEKRGKNQWWDFFDVFRNPTRKDGDNVEKLEKEVDKESQLISMEVNNVSKEGDTINNENIDVASRFVLQNQNFFGDQITETIEPNVDLSNTIAQLDVGQVQSEIKGDTITESPVNNNVINLGQDQGSSESSSGFSGVAAKPTSVFVSTKFNSSGGAIDKFESASSLRSYGAFT